ncbi:MAG: hypothetical protein IPP49_12930 [Saprospiraceae bacterium]|nr:hypothetical protein [Saprospiraceae bacterium]
MNLTSYGAGVNQDIRTTGVQPWVRAKTKTVTPSATTSYTVTVTDALGCTSIDAVTINVYPAPTVDAGANATICNGQSIILTASASSGTAPYTYNWGTTLGIGQSKTVSPTTTTTYTVTVTDAKGCTATDNVIVTVGSNITLTATGASICQGQSGSISATASGGTSPYTYYWGATLGSGQSKTVSPNANTSYTVTVTDINGCTKTAIAAVTVGTPPTASASNDGPLTCSKTNVVMTALPATGVTYLWSNGGQTTQTKRSPYQAPIQ